MSPFPAALALAIAVSQGNHTVDDYKRLIDEYLVAGSAGVPQALAEWPADPLVAAVTEMVTPHPSRQAPFYPVASLDVLVRWLEAAALAHLEAGRVGMQATRPRIAVRHIDTGRMLIVRLRSVLKANHMKRSKLSGHERQALDAGDAFATHWLMAGGALLHGTTDWLRAQDLFTLRSAPTRDTPACTSGSASCTNRPPPTPCWLSSLPLVPPAVGGKAPRTIAAS